MATDLADGLEHSDGMFEITDVKYRNNKFNVCIMANTVDGRLATSFTESTFFCSSLERKGTVSPGKGGIQIHFNVKLQDDDRALRFLQASDLWPYRDRDG